MSIDGSRKIVSRRNILKILAGSAGVAVRCSGSPLSTANGAGSLKTLLRNPARLSASMEGAPRFLNTDEFDTLAAITEAIIPTDEHSPGAKDAGVPFYIDTVLTESDDEKRTFWKRGLSAINQIAQEEFATRFFACSASQQEELLLKLSAKEENPGTLEEKFFVAAKRATIEGYYNSEVGIHKDLEYQGNTMLGEFEGCTDGEHGAAKPDTP